MLRSAIRSSLIAMFAVALSSLANAAAGVITASGVLLERLPLAQCGPSVTHRLECSSVLLVSDTVDLDAWLGQNVRVTGVTIPAFCDVISVTAVEPAPKTLSVCGTPAMGCPLRFKLSPSDGIGGFVLLASAAVDLAPVSFVSGSLLLAPPLVFVAQGFQMNPATTIDVTIPPLAPLVGVSVYLQGAMWKIGPVGPPVFTNPTCLTISPSLAFCIDPTGC